MALPGSGRSARKSSDSGRSRIEKRPFHGHYRSRSGGASRNSNDRLAEWPNQVNPVEDMMVLRQVGIALTLAVGGAMITAPAVAQNEQFIPHLVYRTGAYAPNGIPFANGVADYYRLVN